MRFTLSLAAAISAISLSAQPNSPNAPAVGSKVPDFEASDQAGARQTLGSILGANGAMLVFFRSADW